MKSAKTESVLAIVEKIRTALAWYSTEDGINYIESRGVTEQSEISGVINDILHIAHDSKFDYKSILANAIMRFMAECGTDSKEYAELYPFIKKHFNFRNKRNKK